MSRWSNRTPGRSTATGGFDQHLCALVSEEFHIAGGIEVSPQREDDGRIDVVLGRACCVVGRGFFAVDGPPGVQRAAFAEHRRTSTSGIEHLPTEADHLSGSFGVVVREEGRDVHLGVPEVVAVVAAGRDRLRGDSLLMCARRSLGELEEVPAERLLVRVVAAQLDVRRLPELVEPLTLLGDEPFAALLRCSAQRPRTAISEFFRRDAAGRCGTRRTW